MTSRGGVSPLVWTEGKSLELGRGQCLEWAEEGCRPETIEGRGIRFKQMQDASCKMQEVNKRPRY
jgi:hypothetical protein